MSEVQFEAQFDEWRELFNKFRRDGALPKRERKRFQELTGILKKSNLRSMVEDAENENTAGGDAR